MKNINIAVIDSGLNVTPDIDFCKITYVYSCDGHNFQDENGHGTNIVHTILLHEKRINIFLFKIFQKDLQCNVQELINALRIIYLKLPCIDIINMSLGIPEDNLQLKKYCKRLSERNVKIVAAYNNNDKKESFPASYSFVYGVKSAIYKNCYEYSKTYNNDVRIYGYLPYSIIQKTHITCMGNSFAAAHFTGVLANAYFSKKTFTITDNDIDVYIENQNKFDWIKNNIIIIDDNNTLASSSLKSRGIVGRCLCTKEGYNIVLNYGIKSYDTLVIDNYSNSLSLLLPFIIYNIKRKKNIFCISGFGEDVNSLLYELSRKYECNVYIKYVC